MGVLKVNTIQLENGNAPTAADLGFAAGSVLQVVTDTFTSTESTSSLASSNSFANSSLSVTITPKSTSSKILVTAMVNVGGPDAGDGSVILRVLRDSTAIGIGDASSNRIRATTGRGSDFFGANSHNCITVHVVDEPSKTSATTYTIQFAARGTGSRTVFINKSSTDADTTEYQRTASTLTVMEIAQ